MTINCNIIIDVPVDRTFMIIPSTTFCLYGFVTILVLIIPGSSSDIPLGVTAKSGGPIPTTEELNYAISIIDAAGIDNLCPCLNNITSIDTPYSGKYDDDGIVIVKEYGSTSITCSYPCSVCRLLLPRLV